MVIFKLGMKKLILILLLLTSYPVLAQKTAGQKAPAIYFGLSFSPDYSNVITDKFYPPLTNRYDSIIAPIFGYTTGANMNYQISRRLALDVGFHISHRGYQTDLVPFLDMGHTRAHADFTYLDIHVKANYYLLNSSFSLYLTAGLIPSIFYKNSYYEELQGYSGNVQTRDLDNPEPPDKINLMMLAGFGLDYLVSERLFIRVKPIYRRSLTKIRDDDSSDFYFWSLGANVGVYYNFK